MTFYKVAHLTSVHSRRDTRIFLKECRSLANFGHKVSLIVADGNGSDRIGGVDIYDVGSMNGRLNRIRNAPKKILKLAFEVNADIYHLHDPELLPIGVKLKRAGKIVIFDAHEDVPKQILGKAYINKYFKWIISKSYGIYERWACRRLDAVVSATPFIRDKFIAMGVRSIDINNYPLLDEFVIRNIDWSKKNRQVTYIGGLGRVRGIFEMVKSMEVTKSDVQLVVGGKFSLKSFEEQVTSLSGWAKVDYLGWLDRSDIKKVLSESVGGLVTLHPIINYLDALPVKMFEYMAAGIPVIASDFPFWREIVEGSESGICVNPLDPEEIAAAIDYLVKCPEEAERMGRNGQQAVIDKYNWGIEEEKLCAFYLSLSS